MKFAITEKRVTATMIQKGQSFNLLRTLKHEYTVADLVKKGNRFSRYPTHVELKRDKEETTNFVPLEDFLDMVNAEVAATIKAKGATPEGKAGKKKVEVQTSEKESTERLPRRLEDGELIQVGHEAADCMALIDATEEEAAGVAKSYKSKVGELTAKLKTLRMKLQTGEIWEAVAVRIIYNWTENRMTTVRKDSGELIRETAIPAEDRQVFFTDPGNREQDKKEPEKKKELPPPEKKQEAAPASPATPSTEPEKK